MYDLMFIKVAVAVSSIVSVVLTCLLGGVSGVVIVGASLYPAYLAYRFYARRKEIKSLKSEIARTQAAIDTYEESK